MSTRDRKSRSSQVDDALLSGLNRLKASSNPPVAAQDANTLAEALARQPRSRNVSTSPAQANIPYEYFPNTSGRRVDPIAPVSRVDIVEVVEHATGLGKSSDGDFAAADRLLKWIRQGSVEPSDVFKSIVAGSAGTDPALNARVLSVVAWLIISGGPEVLAPAVYITNAKRPTPALRVCLDVLSSLGYDENPDALLRDDNKVRNMKISLQFDNAGRSTDGMRVRRKNSYGNTVLIAAVEAFAISLGRKLMFHNRYPEVEPNYSLDRFFRKMRIEARADSKRDSMNYARHDAIMSSECLESIQLLTRAAVVAADRLERADVPADITALAIVEACNAYAFAGYLAYKQGKQRGSSDAEISLGEERSCLAELVRRIQNRGGGEARILKRFADPNGLSVLRDETQRPRRPESRHRREVICQFTSFQALHQALEPDLRRHRDIAQ